MSWFPCGVSRKLIQRRWCEHVNLWFITKPLAQLCAYWSSFHLNTSGASAAMNVARSPSAFTTFIFSCRKRAWEQRSEIPRALSPSALVVHVVCFTERWRETATRATVSLLKRLQRGLPGARGRAPQLRWRWSGSCRAKPNSRSLYRFPALQRVTQRLFSLTSSAPRPGWWLRSVFCHRRGPEWPDGTFRFAYTQQSKCWLTDFLEDELDGSWERKDRVSEVGCWNVQSQASVSH